MEKAASSGKEIFIPLDVVIAEAMDANARSKTVHVDEIPDGWMALDIGPETSQVFENQIRSAQTLIWNGPMGVFEMEPFAEGTRRITAAVADAKGITIIGGGDSAAAVEKFGRAGDVTHISTGGGASLEFMEGKTLPGVAALSDL
jgi:phosphoglycerate kinase